MALLATGRSEARDVLFGTPQVITTSTSDTRSVFAADLDGDGDFDVLSASRLDNKIAWYENMDGLGAFGPQQVISTSAESAVSVFAADLDGDGDLDVLSASSSPSKFEWYENTDGMGSFGPGQTITTSAISPTRVFAADLDGDGDQDVLSSSQTDDKIAWYENTDGMGSFGPQQVITTLADAASSVFAADLDGDGDLDVLSASGHPFFIGDNKIAWYENTDGMGSFGPQQLLTESAAGASWVHAADLDGDGDIDVLSAAQRGGEIAWYENTDGMGAFSTPQTVSDEAFVTRAVHAADLDGDGDVDILACSSKKVAWYENTDGNGAFGPQQVIATLDGTPESVFAADLDDDGDVDVLTAGGAPLAWYVNLTPQTAVTHWEIYR